MKNKLLIVLGSALSVSVCSGLSSTILQNDFSDGQGDWAVRAQPAASVVFENDTVNLTPAGSGQPAAVYHSFAPVTLEDGMFLRLTVNVSSANDASRPRDIRTALGFADPLIEGDLEIIRVPLQGYFTTAPSGGNTTDSRVTQSGFEAPDEDVNFFNTTLEDIGELSNTQSIEQDPVTWIWEVARSGDDLVFGGSLNGVAFGNTVLATGSEVIDDFTFNTVGLAHAFGGGETVTYHDAKLEVIPEPTTISLLMGVAVLGLVLYRRRRPL